MLEDEAMRKLRETHDTRQAAPRGDAAEIDRILNRTDSGAPYRLRVVYAGDSPGRKIRRVTGEGLEIHGLMRKPQPAAPLEFDIPRAAIARGELDLQWYGEPWLGGNGRGCQVSEVWLIKK